MYTDCLRKVIQRRDLTETEAGALFQSILAGELSPAQMAGILTALATKGETSLELAGAAKAMRAKAARIQVIGGPVVDIVGTGGDGLDTFNISTASALVVAGAGVVVAKHGNRSASSRCGSADVLEACGLRLDVDPEIVEQAVAELGVGFMFAPKFHSAMRHVAPVRKELGVRSIFNMLGPLANPAGAGCLLLGVFAPELTEMFAESLRDMKIRSALVVHGHDGMDEITVCDATRASHLDGDTIRTFDIQPQQFFGDLAEPESLSGGDATENAEILRGVLSGTIQGPKRDIVLVNAGAALWIAGKAPDHAGGIALAEESIQEGKALEKLEQLARFTQENA